MIGTVLNVLISSLFVSPLAALVRLAVEVAEQDNHRDRVEEDGVVETLGERAADEDVGPRVDDHQEKLHLGSN